LGARAAGSGSLDGEAVEPESNAGGSQLDARRARDIASHVAGELAVIMKDQSGVDGTADVIRLCACATNEERKYTEDRKGYSSGEKLGHRIS